MTESQRELLLCCRWNETNDAIQALATSNDLDLMYNNGIVFTHAIQRNNTTLLGALLKYYEEHKPEDRESHEYKNYIDKFHIMFTEVIRSFTNQFTGEYTFSKEIESVLKPYLDDEDDTEVLVPDISTARDLPNENLHEQPFLVEWPDNLNPGSAIYGENSAPSDCGDSY